MILKDGASKDIWCLLQVEFGANLVATDEQSLERMESLFLDRWLCKSPRSFPFAVLPNDFFSRFRNLLVSSSVKPAEDYTPSTIRDHDLTMATCTK